MVNIATEAMLDLKQAAELCRVSVKTIRNWATRVTAPRLETAKLGGKIVTTREALQRFTVQRDTEVHQQRQVAESLRPQTNDAHDEAMRRLREIHGVTF
jgi:hypothetical protein